MESVFAKAEFPELWPTAQIAVGFRSNVGVNDHAVLRDGDFQVFDVAGPVEELPVFVRLDFGIPSQLGDRVSAREKCVAGHVAPGQRTKAAVLAAKHPDSPAIHQGRKQ